MSHKSHALSTLSRWGFGLKSTVEEDDDSWYIPYNGPYEPPKPVVRSSSRDSWGDLSDPEKLLEHHLDHHHHPHQHQYRRQHGGGDGVAPDTKTYEYGGWTTPGDLVRRESRGRLARRGGGATVSTTSTTTIFHHSPDIVGQPLAAEKLQPQKRLPLERHGSSRSRRSRRRSAYTDVPASPISWISTPGDIGESPSPARARQPSAVSAAAATTVPRVPSPLNRHQPHSHAHSHPHPYMPFPRHTHHTVGQGVNWGHMAHFLPFASGARKLTPPPGTATTTQTKRKNSSFTTNTPRDPTARPTDLPRLADVDSRGRRRARSHTAESQHRTPVSEDDYYTSYYSTLLVTPTRAEREALEPFLRHDTAAARRDAHRRSLSAGARPSEKRQQPQPQPQPAASAERAPRTSQAKTSASHPYAYPFPPSSAHQAVAAATVEDNDDPHARQRHSPSRRLERPIKHPFSAATSPAFPEEPSSSSWRGPARSEAHQHGRAAPQLQRSSVDETAEPRAPSLRSSVSVPNLRAHARPAVGVKRSPPLGASSSHHVFGQDECWLMAETWCDALIFPRPRLKMMERVAGQAPSHGDSDELLPLQYPDGNGDGKTRQEAAVVLPREVAAASETAQVGPSKPATIAKRRRSLTLPGRLPGHAPPSTLKREPPGANPSHRKGTSSFSQDDMALPSPTSSLQRVLREGALLEAERRVWQQQAQRSFQNGRSRSKSLTRPNARRPSGENHRPVGNLEYLAARSLLGRQAVTRSVRAASRSTHNNHHRGPSASSHGNQTHSQHSHGHQSHSQHSHGHQSHSQNSQNSHARTNSKSSSGKSRLSRTSSSRKFGLRLAKSTPMLALCGSLSSTSGDVVSPLSESAGPLEIAIRSGVTKRVRLRDTMEEISPSAPSPETALPVPPEPVTAIPAQGSKPPSPIGVAFSTPQPDGSSADDHNHPYPWREESEGRVRGNDSRRPSAGAEYAGPHLSSPPAPAFAQLASLNDDVSVRHRLPPHAMLHPYAQAQPMRRSPSPLLTESGIRPRPRSGSLVLPPNKLWIPGDLDDVREVLPEEIQYSPYIPSPEVTHHSEHSSSHAYILPPQNRQTQLGMEEVLASSLDGTGASRVPPQLDLSGLKVQARRVNAGEVTKNDPGSPVEPHSPTTPTSAGSFSVRRKPVRYEAHIRTPRTPYTINTLASSDVLPSINEPPLPSSVAAAPMRVPVNEDGSSSSSPLASTPQTSRSQGVSGEFDRFRDLFFRPGTSPTSASHSSRSGDDIPWETTRRVVTTGLTSLARRLTEEIESSHGGGSMPEQQPSPDGVSPTSERVGPFGSLRETATSAELRFILTELSRSRPDSPPDSPPSSAYSQRSPSRSPSLSSHFPKQFVHESHIVPSDVESSRASSLLEPQGEDDQNFPLFRVRTIEAVTTPHTEQAYRPVSGHLSLVGLDMHRPSRPSSVNDIEGQEGEEGQRVPERDANQPTSTLVSPNSLQLPNSPDTARQSYMTSGSSHMSGLSDFPMPPGTAAPSQRHISSIVDMYGDRGENNDPRNSDRMEYGPGPDRLLRRMTFGQEVGDAENVLITFTEDS